MQEHRNISTEVSAPVPQGQLLARMHWNTHESGAAFDRKKTPYLTEKAGQFIAQQSFFVIAWSESHTNHDELHGSLVMGLPGIVSVLDEVTCVLYILRSPEHARLLQGLQASLHKGYLARPGLFFISHATRERLCVQGSIRMLIQEREYVRVLLHVEQSFFHCPKYIRTRVAGLTTPATVDTGHCQHEQQDEPGYLRQNLFLQVQQQHTLTRELDIFLRQQLLCFLCTVDEHGQCAVNHRGGAPGFIVALPPDEDSPGGTILLPDYAGNGAFEAVGNILETGLATLLIPNYAMQIAVQIAGTVRILEPAELTHSLNRRCIGAERVIALSVQQVEIQSGDWSTTLASEIARAEAVFARSETNDVCSL